MYLDEDSVSPRPVTRGSGYGKTALTKLVALQRMAIGGGFLYVDAKRDQKDVDELYQFAVLTGRVQDMIVVDPGNPSQSHTYNPIADGDEDEIADRILTWIPASTTSPGADHYRQSARQGIATLVGALKALGLAYNFIDLAILIQNQKALQELEDRMRKALPFHPATKNLSLFLERLQGRIRHGRPFARPPKPNQHEASKKRPLEAWRDDYTNLARADSVQSSTPTRRSSACLTRSVTTRS